MSIARALAVDPAVLFLDEPLAAARSAHAPRRLVADLLDIFARRRPWPSCWVTHDRDEALAVGDRVSFLERRPYRADRGLPLISSRTRRALRLPTSSGSTPTWRVRFVERTPTDRRACASRSGVEIACREAPEGPAVACLPPEDVVLFTGSSRRRAAPVCAMYLPGMVKSVGPVGALAASSWSRRSAQRVAALVTRAGG